MENIKGPWYSLQETQAKLDLTQSEILFAIEQGDLVPIIYSPLLHFLALSTYTDAQRTGCAHFKYEGPLTANPQILRRIAKGQKGPFYSKYTILDPSGVSNVSYSCPLSNSLPNEVLTEWVAGSIDEITNNDYHIVAMPFETKSTRALLDLLNKSCDSGNSFSPEQSAKNISSVPYKYNWHYQGNWSTEHLRVPASEISRFTGQSNTPKAPQEAIPIINDGNENQLHTLISRVALGYPEVPAKKAWQLIKADFNSPPPSEFDLENILLEVTDDKITWSSRYSHVQEFYWSSFPSRFSRVKNDVQEHNKK